MRRSPIGRNVGYALMLAFLVSAATARSAHATTITIGDNDGYGFGLADNATVAKWPGLNVQDGGSGMDKRSASEAGASDGSQITDVYSALFPHTDLFDPAIRDFLVTDVGPNSFASADVIFALPDGVDVLPGARLTIDVGDLQAAMFGQIGAAFNGFAQPNLLNIGGGSEDYGKTHVLTFLLNDLAVIGKANADRQFVLTLTRGPNYGTSGTSADKDYVAFDYFELNTDPAPVPEPATLTLLGTGAAVLLGRRLRRKKA